MLAAATGVHARLHEIEPAIHAPTRPRPPADAASLLAFEHEAGHALPPGYRAFLLAADGWEHCYLRMSVFGLAELRGGGPWSRAQELLRAYRDEEVLEHLGVEAHEVVPVAAGQRLHLVLAHRADTDRAGEVMWIDAGALVGCYEDFRSWFADLAWRKYRVLSRVEAGRAQGRGE